MGISISGFTGIDTNSLIDQLVALEQEKLKPIQSSKAAYQLKIQAYDKLKTFLMDMRGKADALSKTTSFDLFNAKSTNDNIVSIRGGTGSVDGQYDIRVFQIASNEKMISRDGMIADQNAALSTMGVTPGDISIAGTTITIDADDTIQDLRSKINNATDATGSRLPVTAAVIKVADNNYRLVLTAKQTGSAGVEYKDISGSTLQDLGIIASADGDKGNVKQQLQSAGDVTASFSGLAAGQTITFNGTDREGNAVSGTFTKTATNTLSDFLEFVKKTYHGMVDVTTDGTGNMVMTDLVAGTSRLAMTNLTINGAVMGVNTTAIGEEGRGVLATGRDAYFSVEGVVMRSSTNSAGGFISGVTLDFHKASVSEAVTVGLTRDFAGITKKFKDLIETYNALVRFKKDATSMGDPSNSNSKKGDLAGDMTISTILNQIRTVFKQQFNLLGGDLTSYTMAGLETDPKTGEFSLDEDMFKKALENNLDGVMRLFTANGVAGNSNVTLGRFTADTQAGAYTITEIDDTHFQIQLNGDPNTYVSDARSGDVINFSDGPAKGLALTAPAGSIGVGNTISFTLQKGLSTILMESVDKLTNANTGIVQTRQESMKKGIKTDDDRINRLNDRIEAYRLRLVKQFTEMQKSITSLQEQSSKMLSQLGNSSS